MNYVCGFVSVWLGINLILLFDFNILNSVGEMLSTNFQGKPDTREDGAKGGTFKNRQGRPR